MVGTRPIRPDGVDKVTGRALYGSDIRLTGTLTGKVLRSPHAHARIRSIDVSRALALSGVKAVVTGKDLPQAAPDEVIDLGEGAGKVKYLRDNILATDKVLYEGHAVAAVAATSAAVADAALKLIAVDYEPLPAVTDVRKAMQPEAPSLHGTLTPDAAPNISGQVHHRLGDPEAGFAAADVIVENEFTTETVHQGYVEPHVATAMWNADGQLTIWDTTQGAFSVREQCAEILSHPVSQIRVVPTEIGGGFGGKINVYLEPVAALLSRQSGQPVKIAMTRAEVFRSSGPAPASWVRIKIGATRAGRITAAEAEFAFEAGAYPGDPCWVAAICVFAAYEIPNGRIDGFGVVLNKPSSAAYRAPGAPQVAFAAEQMVDELAERLNLDPIDFRLLNSAREGTVRIDGGAHGGIGSIECLEAARAHPHYHAPLGRRENPDVSPQPHPTTAQPPPQGGREVDPSPSTGEGDAVAGGVVPSAEASSSLRRGRGVANGFWVNAGMQSSCTISVSADGSVHLVEGSTDIGGTRAAIAMQAAEILGLEAHEVKPVVADTDSIGFTSLTGGSRTAFATGIAAIEAAREVVRQMKERAAQRWELDPEEVDFAKGVFTAATNPTRRLTFKELATQLEKTGGPITGSANVDPQGRGVAFATCIADVEVDIETGKVGVLRFTVVQDAGKAVHPSYVEGQMQGGAVQGIGWALSEEYVMDEKGHMLNPSFLDYRMPTALDVPMIDTVIVEVPNPGHPFGVRGVGEVPIVAPAAAIANALHRALGGVRLTRLPMNPRTVLEATGLIDR